MEVKQKRPPQLTGTGPHLQLAVMWQVTLATSGERIQDLFSTLMLTKVVKMVIRIPMHGVRLALSFRYSMVEVVQRLQPDPLILLAHQQI